MKVSKTVSKYRRIQLKELLEERIKCFFNFVRQHVQIVKKRSGENVQCYVNWE